MGRIRKMTSIPWENYCSYCTFFWPLSSWYCSGSEHTHILLCRRGLFKSHWEHRSLLPCTSSLSWLSLQPYWGLENTDLYMGWGGWAFICPWHSNSTAWSNLLYSDQLGNWDDKYKISGCLQLEEDQHPGEKPYGQQICIRVYLI